MGSKLEFLRTVSGGGFPEEDETLEMVFLKRMKL